MLEKNCKLSLSFEPSDKITSTVTYQIYPCVNHEGNQLATCNTSNVVYLITCNTCHLQYVGETAQNLNLRFAKHRRCMNGNVNSKSCKHLSDHFSKGLCKNSNYTVQSIENVSGNGRTARGALDPGVVVVRRKTESEWMLKLRTVFPYGLNDRVDSINGDDAFSKAKSKYGEDLVATLFHSLLMKFDRNFNNSYNRYNKAQLNYKLFIQQL